MSSTFSIVLCLFLVGLKFSVFLSSAIIVLKESTIITKWMGPFLMKVVITNVCNLNTSNTLNFLNNGPECAPNLQEVIALTAIF